MQAQENNAYDCLRDLLEDLRIQKEDLVTLRAQALLAQDEIRLLKQALKNTQDRVQEEMNRSEALETAIREFKRDASEFSQVSNRYFIKTNVEFDKAALVPRPVGRPPSKNLNKNRNKN